MHIRLNCFMYQYVFYFFKIKDSADSKSTTTMLSNDELDQSLKATQESNVSTATQSTKPSGSKLSTLSDTGQSQPQTVYTSTHFSRHPKSSTLTLTTKPTAFIRNISSENTSAASKKAPISTGATSLSFTEKNSTTTMAISTEQTSSDVYPISKSPEETTITFPGQTGSDVTTTSTKTLTFSSTEHTTIPEESTVRVQHSCSMNSTSELNLNLSGAEADPCLASSVLCNNESAFGTVPNFCECTMDGIWTIIQKRFDGSVNFCRNWVDYKMGFGDLKGEFWLGNDIIYQITSSANYKLKIYITDWDTITKYAEYDTFIIADEANNYRLSIGGYSGDAEDALYYHNLQMFSTTDRDNDANEFMNIAEYFSSGWWFGPMVTVSNLNGPYRYGPAVGDIGIMWSVFGHEQRYSMKETKMLIKPVN